jgi:hypothetical protein
MVVLLVTGAVPPAVAGLLGAGAIVVTRVLTTRRIAGSPGRTVILVAGMIPLSTAMTETGAAQKSPTRSKTRSAASGATRYSSGSCCSPSRSAS